MGRRSDHNKDQLREMILQATGEIIKREGIFGISTRKIAASIEYTVGTLYHVFENLHNILLGVNMMTMDSLTNLIVSKIDKCEKSEVLTVLSETYSDYSKSNNGLWRLLFEYQFEKLVKLPDWYNQRVQAFFDMIGKIIADAIPEFHGREKDALQLFWSFIHGTTALRQMLEKSCFYVDSEEKMLKLFLSNLKISNQAAKIAA